MIPPRNRKSEAGNPPPTARALEFYPDLDADIRGFFDTLDHGWLVKFVEHRIADRRVVRLIQKWLNAGVLEEGTRTRSAVGTVQGGSISPLLANLYLHYVFDLWVQRWRKK